MIKNIKQNLILSEGKNILIYIIIFTLISLYLNSKILFAIILFFTLFSFYFFRNPNRKISNLDPLDIISPADGRVVDIDYNYNKLEGYNQKISIFLSPLDAHVNWIPITGTVVKVEYKKGTFALAFTDKSSELNERNDIIIEDCNSRKILVRQIAGTVARRIVCWVKEEDNVNIADKYGMIKFGSRVDILLPKNVEIKLKLSDYVFGGQTTIGRWLC